MPPLESRKRLFSIGPPIGVLLAFLLRLAFMHSHFSMPAYFYTDSSVHVMQSRLLLENGNWRTWQSNNLSHVLYALAMRAGVDILYAPWAVNFSLAVFSLLLFYDAVRRLADGRCATIAVLLSSSVPAFSRLVFSGEPEMTGIALTVLAFWLPVRGLDAGEIGRLTFDLTTVAVLALGRFARPEMIGLALLYAAFMMLRWKRKSLFMVIAALWCLLWISPKFSWILDRAAAAHVSNSTNWTGGPTGRFLRLPRWFMVDFLPLNLITLLGLGALRRGTRAQPFGVLTVILACYGLMLYVASCAYIGSFEIERNMAALCFLAMAPAAHIIDQAAGWHSGKYRWAAGLMLAAMVAVSWRDAAASAPFDPPNIANPKALGWELRRLEAGGELGTPSQLILVEKYPEMGWGDVHVFSGLPRRVRLISPASEPMDELSWDGVGDVSIVVVRSQTAENQMKSRFSAWRLIERWNDYRIYRRIQPSSGTS